MFASLNLFIISIFSLFSGASDQEYYQVFMSYGFQRFAESNYVQAANNFKAASVLDVTDDQKIRAYYHKSVSDSCENFRNLGNLFYENGDFEKARYFYQKVVFFNDKDTLCVKKSTICENKLRTNPPVNNLSMIKIDAGEFVMGNKNGRVCENFEHNVFINEIYVDIFEVTNQQYANFLNEIRISEDKVSDYIDIEDVDCQIYCRNSYFYVKTGMNKYPVVEVSWYGANAYAKHYGKRLPTEAEWEYFATMYEPNQNFNSGALSAVGSKKPNKAGIYDLYGNVREWCADYYWENFYQISPKYNPKTVSDSDMRVVRGNAFNSFNVNYFTRDCELPFETSANLGFRCVKDVH